MRLLSVLLLDMMYDEYLPGVGDGLEWDRYPLKVEDSAVTYEFFHRP